MTTGGFRTLNQMDQHHHSRRIYPFYLLKGDFSLTACWLPGLQILPQGRHRLPGKITAKPVLL
jgi:hypothetical protein